MQATRGFVLTCGGGGGDGGGVGGGGGCGRGGGLGGGRPSPPKFMHPAVPYEQMDDNILGVETDYKWLDICSCCY